MIIYYEFSIISGFFLLEAFPCEVFSISLLGVPSNLRIKDVVSPAHDFTMLNCRTQRSTHHPGLGEGVSCCWSPVHKGTLVGAGWLEFNNPLFPDFFVTGVVVYVFFLGIIDSGDLSSGVLSVPNVGIEIPWLACTLITLISLVVSNFVCVWFYVEWVSIGGDAESLDGAILQLLSVRVVWSCYCQDISHQFLRDCFKGLLIDNLAYAWDGLRHIKIL